jgi:hypothetical protein
MTTFRAPDFDLTKPGKLIAAVPAVLGFVPEKSLVLVTLERGGLGCVMRIDLSAQVLDAVDHLAEVASMGNPDAAVALIVDEDGAACRMCTDEHRQLAEVLRFVLEERDVALLAVYVVDEIAEGGRWHSVDEGEGSGQVEDPRSSPMAVAAVLNGRPLYRDRGELQAVIAVTDVDRTAALSTVMERAGHDGGLRPEPDARGDVEHALAMIRAVDRGRFPVDEDLVRLACGLTDPRVRDTLYALAVGRDADRAESLWASLARTLPDPWRAEALVLLAFSAYARGDGPLAGVSLEAALLGNASHRMAGMLDQALQSGMRPDQIRELAQTGYRLAKRLGVRLPPRRAARKRAG